MRCALPAQAATFFCTPLCPTLHTPLPPAHLPAPWLLLLAVARGLRVPVLTCLHYWFSYARHMLPLPRQPPPPALPSSVFFLDLPLLRTVWALRLVPHTTHPFPYTHFFFFFLPRCLRASSYLPYAFPRGDVWQLPLSLSSLSVPPVNNAHAATLPPFSARWLRRFADCLLYCDLGMAAVDVGAGRLRRGRTAPQRDAAGGGAWREDTHPSLPRGVRQLATHRAAAGAAALLPPPLSTTIARRLLSCY